MYVYMLLSQKEKVLIGKFCSVTKKMNITETIHFCAYLKANIVK